MQALRDSAHLFKHGLEISLKLLESLALRRPVAGVTGTKGLDVEGEGDQSLLDAVVEGALNALARLVVGGDDPCSRKAR